MSPSKQEPVLSIAIDWKGRLTRSLEGIFIFEESRQGCETLTRAHSRDQRAMLELVEQNGVLRHGSLRLALTDQDELEAIKLGCWTLLFLKSLFPGWRGVEQWVQESGDNVTEDAGPIEKQLHRYRLSCGYHALASLMEYEIVMEAS